MSKRPRVAGDTIDTDKLDRLVADARRNAEKRQLDYREQSLRIHPWICARCGREFTRANLHELTVHHKDHNHDNNPADGSNWENLCLYCHDNEHQKYVDHERGYSSHAESQTQVANHKPFAGLADMLNTKNDQQEDK